jgi:signal transduction histidine kinase
MTIRARLALWCAALVTISGALVVVLVLAITGSVLHDKAKPVRQQPPPPGAPAASGVQQFAQAQHQWNVVSSTLSEARTIGLIVVGGLALLSIGIGWTVAGRMLRPVQDLAQTASDVSEVSLHRRIAYAGPPDELKGLADAFDAMLDRLDAAFAAQRRFVADASHELRTPLASIRAEVEAVLEDPDASAEAERAAIARIGSTLDRGDALVTALLTLSRSEALVTRVRADLSDIARDVVTATPGVARLDARLELRTARLAGDPGLLERLVANLVENAARYNEPGGMLAITTGQQNGSVVLTVANDGPLVGMDELPRLTERFHRRERDRGRGRGGFGLGLAIADAIARAHGGSLALTARDQGGLTVTATLPASGGSENGHRKAPA